MGALSKIKAINEVEKRLYEVKVGDTFKVGKFEFIVLEQDEKNKETKVLLKNFWTTAKFDGDTNDYKNSWIRKSLNSKFLSELADEVGKDNINLHMVDLMADDGRVDYGLCYDRVSLLTCENYRKYVYILDEYRITSDWWWLATPLSTSSNGHGHTVRCVNGGGTLNYGNCDVDIGVRPFCILNSNITVY